MHLFVIYLLPIDEFASVWLDAQHQLDFSSHVQKWLSLFILVL